MCPLVAVTTELTGIIIISLSGDNCSGPERQVQSSSLAGAKDAEDRLKTGWGQVKDRLRTGWG